MPGKKKVVVAMSGGVDSSVAAALLLEAGWDVVGLTMLLDGTEGEGPGRAGSTPKGGWRSVDDARAAAASLGIPHFIADFRKSFERRIVRDFCEVYRQGRTPNPCVRCNRFIKFGLLLRKAAGLGAACLATGHYARVERDSGRRLFRLKKGVDPSKDQSYFLYSLGQAELRKILFPLGGLTKSRVREKARILGLAAAGRPESQEICFVPGDDYARFLRPRVPAAFRPGPIVDAAGGVLGTHRGIGGYTIGQRRGLGIAAPRPLYVLAIDPELNTVVAGPDEDLWRRRLRLREVRWVSGVPPKGPRTLKARIRYRQRESPAAVIPIGATRALVEFRRPQRAVTPGQAVVFYDGDEVVGGGTIASALD